MWNYYTDFRKDFDRMSLGFDDIFDDLKKMSYKQSNYPPYNIRKYEDGSYRVEVACAGFKESELSVQYSKSKLFVKGNQEENKNESTGGYTHRGVAARDFMLTFDITNINSVSANYENGMLYISLYIKDNTVVDVPINKSIGVASTPMNLVVNGNNLVDPLVPSTRD